MQTADRLTKIPPYLFMELRKKINQAKADGVDVISLAIGDPVEPTPAPIIAELCRRAQDPENHRYPTDEEKGMLAFRREVARWYETRYGVDLKPETEILGLIGSKEGCHHFVLARINPGDVVLMTDPGYPAYRASIL
ncbi:MAG TPA: aminotransferase class I/II-fold pyridoxal phosphate-dependent enzyme, partial [Syntrophales bacterium]|nr:aminotransferase class I/II-fold pyridoxal phosphate-dependent enzyme [Syntrophales bacterium]